MQTNRNGEAGSFPFRSQRLSNENGKWYFSTREGTLNGPFHTKEEAEKSLVVFLAGKILEASAEEFDTISSGIEIEEDLKEMVEEVLAFFRARISSGVNAALAWAQNRVTDLREDSKGTSLHKKRIDILLFAMDQERPLGFRW